MKPGPVRSASPATRLRPGADPWRTLVDTASAPYRASGRFAWHFARGKLGLDPVFRHLIGNGLVAARARVLDIGCGQGLLANLLGAAERQARAGGWPAGWAQPPLDCRVTGIELMPKDVHRARDAWSIAAGAGGTRAEFVCGDMRETPFPPSDVVVILDVLHYIAVDEQDAVLERVRQALAPGGRLLLRVGDAAARRAFGISQWVDRAVFLARGHRATPLHGRPVAAWQARLEALGFSAQARPMSQGTPFANVLLTAKLPRAARSDERRAGAGGGPSAAAVDAPPAVRPLPA